MARQPKTPKQDRPGAVTTPLNPQAGTLSTPDVAAPPGYRGRPPGGVARAGNPRQQSQGRSRATDAPARAAIDATVARTREVGALRHNPPNTIASQPGRGYPGTAPVVESQYSRDSRQEPQPYISDVDIDSNWFSPMQPVWPFGPPYVTYPRTWDYPVGINLAFQNRRQDLYAFLQNLANSGEGVLRPVIEARKDQLLRMPHKFQVKDTPKKEDKRLKELEEFFEQPDGLHDFETWLRMLLEARFVTDTATIYNWRRNNGKPYRLDILDGTTLHVLVDDAGRIPDPPNPAYQQIVKGLPMDNFTREEIIYAPHNPRPYLPIYGMSEVEQIYLRLTSLVRKEIYVLDQWMQGTIPDMILSCPESWCYSDDTEVLTKRGWLRFADVDEQADEFATRNKKGIFEWQRATGINRTHYRGKMVSLHSRTIDCLVNPPHRVLLSDYHTHLEKIVLARDLLEGHRDNDRIPVTSRWLAGKEIGPRIFHHEQTRGQPRDLTMLGDQFCAFMGAWLAEGYLSERTAYITQVATGKAHWDYLGLLTDILGRPPGYYGDSFGINCVPLVDYLRQFGTAAEKFIPQEIMDAPQRQIEIFLRFFFLGDGAATRPVAYTSSRRMADQLQELTQKVGLSATIAEDDRRGRTVEMRDGHTLTARHINYAVSLSYSKVRRFEVSEVHYDGPIACVAVPNGILYVRRNGKPCWSGNTPEQVANMQAAYDTLLSGNLAAKTKMRLVPNNVKPVLTRGTTAEILAALEKFEERGARIVCFCFSIPPTPFVSMMNRATSQSLADEAATEGLYPLMNWSKAILNRIVADWFGYEDIEYVWTPTPDVDPLKQAQSFKIYVDGGMMKRNEVRESLDLPPDPDGDVLTVTAGAVVTPLNLIVHPPPPPAPMLPGPGKPGLGGLSGPNGKQPPQLNGNSRQPQRALPPPEPKDKKPGADAADGKLLLPSAEKKRVRLDSLRESWRSY